MKTNSPVTGVREERALQAVEIRDEADGLIFEGYAAVFNSPYDVFGGPDEGGWTEIMEPGAFNRTLKANPDVPLNVDHAGTPLARTTSGTMKLSTDDHGLKVRANLDPRSPRVQEIAVAMERRDLTEMSFAFWTVKQEFDEEEGLRTLKEVNIDRGDVSIVTHAANPATSANISELGATLAALQKLDFDTAMAEVRSMDKNILADAHKYLGKLLSETSPRTQRNLTVAEAIQLKKRSADSAHQYLARTHP